MWVVRNAIDITTVMRTLADPTRRAVFERIVEAGEITAGALAQNATVSQPAISQHLRALRETKLVSERREGKHVHYRADPSWLSSDCRLALVLRRVLARAFCGIGKAVEGD